MLPHEEWLLKAHHDLDSAQVLFDSEKPLLDIAIYHTQQSAEKALKAFLVWKNIEVEKTHNLIRLNDLCCQQNSTFGELLEAVIRLNPYSSLFRYPHGELSPSRPETDQALKNARQVLNFVRLIIG